MMADNRSIFVRLTGNVNTSLERHFWRWASLFVTAFLACSIARDLRVKMWIDELITLHVAQQAGSAEVVKTIIEGSDAAPPLYAMIVRSILPIAKHEALAVRLPATLGYCGMIVCLLAFCRRRLPAAYSFIASLLACEACLYYSSDGRSYGIVLGCAAGALLCWQTAAEGRRRGAAITLFALCLALMIAMHYYAIFFLVPLLLAEMARTRASGKLDFSILAAMVPALLVLGLHYPLIAAARQIHSHHWSPASLLMIEPFYSSYCFQPLLYVCPPALVVLAVLPKQRSDQPEHDGGMLMHEWVLIGALTLMVPLVVVVSKYATHVFVDRYVLWAVIGFALLAGTVLCTAVRGQAAVGVTLIGVLLAVIARQEIRPLRGMAVLRQAEAVRHELETLPNGPEPIIIPNSHVFMELCYYSDPRLVERYIYPVSRDLDLHYLGNDIDPVVLVPLSHHTKLHVQAYDALLAEYPRFLLAATPNDYLPWHLVSAGYRVVPVRSTATQPVLFEVEAPPKK
jgi:hypothetical protein